MILICSIIFLFVFFCLFMFLAAGGVVAFSNDKLPAEQKPEPVKTEPVVVETPKVPKTWEVATPKVTIPKINPPVHVVKTPVKKFYIELNNGQLIELFTKAEVTKAKKDGFKVVEK